MEDEDLLPTHHPLQEYISSLGLYDAAPSAKRVPSEYTRFTSLLFKGWHLLCSSIKECSSSLFMIICFVKLSIIETILAFPCWLNEDDTITRVHFNQLKQEIEYGPGAIACNILFYSFILYASLRVYLKGQLILFLLYTFPLLVFLLIFIVCLLIRRLLFSISCMTTHNRNVTRNLITLLQQAELSCGPLPVTPSGSLYPDILKGFHQLTHQYTLTLLNLSLYLSFEHEVVGCLSTQQLETLKEQFPVTPQTGAGDLKMIKMHREIMGLLEMDLTHKCSGIVCFIHNLSAVRWFRLLCVIWNWRQSLRTLQQELHYYDHFRKLLLEDKPPLPELSTGGGLTKTATIDALLLRLTVTLQSAHDLHTFLHQRAQADTDDTDSGEDGRAIILFNHIHQQLQACSSLGETMYSLLAPNSASSSGQIDDTCGMPTEQAMGATDTLVVGFSTVTSLKAQDIDPEDDVLEDMAIGSETVDDGNRIDNLDDLSSLHSVATLHPSVLKELTMAISCRRVEMEAREREALRKRGGRPDIGRPNGLATTRDCANKDTSQASNDTLPNSTKLLSSEQQEHIEDTHQLQTDEHLESFFSPCVAKEYGHDSVKQQLRKREQRSAANPRKVVARRHLHFQRVTTRGDVTGAPDQPPSAPRTPGVRPHLPVSPIVSSPDFAAALLKERQRKGYAELEVFGYNEDSDDNVDLVAKH